MNAAKRGGGCVVAKKMFAGCKDRYEWTVYIDVRPTQEEFKVVACCPSTAIWEALNVIDTKERAAGERFDYTMIQVTKGQMVESVSAA